MNGNEAKDIDQPLPETIARHVPVRSREHFVPKWPESRRGDLDATQLISRGLSRSLLESFDEIGKVRRKRLCVIIADECQRLSPTFAE